MRRLLIVAGLACVGCAAEQPNIHYTSLKEAVAAKYAPLGVDQLTANCLAKSMVLAIPAADQPVILAYINGEDRTARAETPYDKWIVIGHEKRRPELNDTMYGYCPLQWSKYVRRGTMR